MATYIVNWSDSSVPGKTNIGLPDKQLDSTSTSLVLTGRGVPNYGEIQQENFIRLLEHFASSEFTQSSAPKNATIGQLWYVHSTKSLKLRITAPNASTDNSPAWAAGWKDIIPLQSNQAGKFLTTDGSDLSWAPVTTGTVTSVALSGGSTGLTISGGPITNNGTLTLGGTLAIANGGTGVAAATTAEVINALLPGQSGKSGNLLTTDGSNVSWTSVAGVAGPTGPQGPAGAASTVPGPTGPTGPQGPPGTSGTGGGGTVTTVSISTANGVSGSVANPTTAPSITLALGDITPTSISVTATTAASSTTTGAVKVAGGLGVAGDVWATNVKATGDVTAGASDKRLKKRLSVIDDAVSKVRQLTGYTYSWDQSVCIPAGYDFDDARQVGLLAQDVEEVLPEAVAPSPANADYLTVRYEKLVALLVEAVKQQADEIDAIKQRLGSK